MVFFSRCEYSKGVLPSRALFIALFTALSLFKKKIVKVNSRIRLGDDNMNLIKHLPLPYVRHMQREQVSNRHCLLKWAKEYKQTAECCSRKEKNSKNSDSTAKFMLEILLFFSME